MLCLLLVVGTAYGTQYTVQPYAIARDAWELRPVAGGVYWPNSLTRAFFGTELTYRFASSDREWAPAAVGVSVAFYSPFNAGTDTHPAYPLNETQLSASAYFAYFPFPAGAVRPAFAWSTLEPYALAGMGVLRTRPLPVIDPNRNFDWNDLGDVEVRVGARVFRPMVRADVAVDRPSVRRTYRESAPQFGLDVGRRRASVRPGGPLPHERHPGGNRRESLLGTALAAKATPDATPTRRTTRRALVLLSSAASGVTMI